MQNYKDLKVWEKAHSFTLQVYEITSLFPKEETYGLTNQLRRSASSIPANIAEGCGKNSKQDFANFLNIALGSSNESEYFLILSKDLKYLIEETFTRLSNLINEIKGMLINLINKVRA
jgi:four helix bundle protein